MGLLIVIIIIPILITIVILDKCTKNNTSWQIMLNIKAMTKKARKEVHYD
ncbi:MULTISPECIES: hypothetical protein [Clostridium]|uniref:Uncharacterized protein n=1 Tax=Clostridium frigoriphilum TaxID=443253 RepID=A0ABU7USS0_9CLOT|nr:hypothetical protein [Clostridium sp. DSM 17811]MBU3101288.1 hypothetical protein [Clostridium sp. DSM 17811]